MNKLGSALFYWWLIRLGCAVLFDAAVVETLMESMTFFGFYWWYRLFWQVKP